MPFSYNNLKLLLKNFWIENKATLYNNALLLKLLLHFNFFYPSDTEIETFIPDVFIVWKWYHSENERSICYSFLAILKCKCVKKHISGFHTLILEFQIKNEYVYIQNYNWQTWHQISN